MRAFYFIVGILFFYGGLRLLLALAGAIFFVAGMLDLFLFDNQASGLIAALIGVVTLACGYMFELWIDSPVKGPKYAGSEIDVASTPIQENARPSAPQARSRRGSETAS